MNFKKTVDRALLLMELPTGCLTKAQVLKFGYRDYHLEGRLDVTVSLSQRFFPLLIESCLP